jgi:hypothetical protein
VIGRARLVLWSSPAITAGTASARPAALSSGEARAAFPRARLFKWID